MSTPTFSVLGLLLTNDSANFPNITGSPQPLVCSDLGVVETLAEIAAPD